MDCLSSQVKIVVSLSRDVSCMTSPLLITILVEEEESNASQTRITQKSHHGWLAQKIFRRSSTYTLKAKTTYKPISKKKSLGGIRLLSEDGPTNILTGRTLEEICRLGGLGTLELPLEHAVDKLTLPVCLSATATYLLDLGMLYVLPSPF